MKYAIDFSVRRVGGGRVVIGGSPLKLFRLTPAGSTLFDHIQSGDDIDTSRTNLTLLDRLLDSGVIHPMPHSTPLTVGPTATATATATATVAPSLDFSVVIPAFDVDDAALSDIVASCQSGGARQVIIVDDASPRPVGGATREIDGATIIRHPKNNGPATARMTGLDRVDTELVAFVDTDVTLPEHWAAPLLAHFSDERVALVAPRIASAPGIDVIARYETTRSPLDLGPGPARVRAGTRVSYVPTAVTMCRVAALRDVGGFDQSIRVGEDVDLVWRLDEAGYRVRYEPAVIAIHRPRPTLVTWLRQRFDYGSSAPALAERHPGALAPVRVSGWSAASWVAVVGGWPIIGTLIAAVTTALLARKLRDVPDGPSTGVRLAGLGHLYAGRSLAAGITRAWWPIAAVAAMVSRRARRAVLLAVVVPPTIDWVRTRPPVDLAVYVGLRALDDAAYGAGLLRGVIEHRSVDALIPDLTSWPKTKARPA